MMKLAASWIKEFNETDHCLLIYKKECIQFNQELCHVAKKKNIKTKTIVERCSSTSQKQHQIRRMQQFVDVSGSQDWCSYYKQGKCNQILSVILLQNLSFPSIKLGSLMVVFHSQYLGLMSKLKEAYS